MTESNQNQSAVQAEDAFSPPALRRDARGQLDHASLPEIIQWFLDYDQRVAVIKHPRVEEVFQWKQQETEREGESVYLFHRAEDRLAVGIVQALMEHRTQATLHDWIGQLLNALDEAAKTNAEISEAYRLNTTEGASAVEESEKIPARSTRTDYLTCCWLEALCTAEVRVLGWIYQELYGQPFRP